MLTIWVTDGRCSVLQLTAARRDTHDRSALASSMVGSVGTPEQRREAESTVAQACRFRNHAFAVGRPIMETVAR